PAARETTGPPPRSGQNGSASAPERLEPRPAAGARQPRNGPRRPEAATGPTVAPPARDSHDVASPSRQPHWARPRRARPAPARPAVPPPATDRRTPRAAPTVTPRPRPAIPRGRSYRSR